MIPAATRARAQLTLRDTIGTLIGGRSTPAGRIASATGGSTGALAAFTMAVHASALDFDDGHYEGGAIHPGSVIIPSLVVALPDTDTDLHSFLTAQIVGYEIGLRAARLLWPRHELDTYHCTGTAATLGAAAAVAKLRGADADGVARAIAIAWAHAPMATFQLPMVKESIGWSAATAVFAADLAQAGFMAMPTGVRSAMDATFTPTPFHRPGAMDDPFVASLGTVFEAGNTYFKPYAACRYTHTAIRSLQELITGHSLAATDIARIEVHTHLAAANLRDQQPASLDHGQYSFPFVLAAVMCNGRAGAEEISEAALTDPVRLGHAAKVTVAHDPLLDAHYPTHYGTRIVVHTLDGHALERTRLVAPGDEGDPMSADDLAAKFVRLTESVHGTATAVALAAALVDPTRSDVRGLVAQALGGFTRAK